MALQNFLFCCQFGILKVRNPIFLSFPLFCNIPFAYFSVSKVANSSHISGKFNILTIWHHEVHLRGLGRDEVGVQGLHAQEHLAAVRLHTIHVHFVFVHMH